MSSRRAVSRTAGRLARRLRRPQVALLSLLLLLVVGYAVRATQHPDHRPDRSTVSTASAGLDPSLHAVALSTLPAQARQTVALIQSGGPFPYARDGVVFRNAEHHLPTEPANYYHEYTVPTPGESDRGARRIIVGTGGQYYYTNDHYDSFVRVDVSR